MTLPLPSARPWEGGLLPGGRSHTHTHTHHTQTHHIHTHTTYTHTTFRHTHTTDTHTHHTQTHHTHTHTHTHTSHTHTTHTHLPDTHTPHAPPLHPHLHLPALVSLAHTLLPESNVSGPGPPDPLVGSEPHPLGTAPGGIWASLVAQLVKNPPAMQETWVRSLAWEGPLEKGRLPTWVFWPGESHGLSRLRGRCGPRPARLGRSWPEGRDTAYGPATCGVLGHPGGVSGGGEAGRGQEGPSGSGEPSRRVAFG